MEQTNEHALDEQLLDKANLGVRIKALARRAPFTRVAVRQWDADRETIRQLEARVHELEATIDTTTHQSDVEPAPEPEPEQLGRTLGDLWPAGHYYSPIPSIDALEELRVRRKQSTPDELAGIDLRAMEQLALLSRLGRFDTEVPFPADKVPGMRYYYRNEVFNRSDATMLYCMLREYTPRRVIEIGSGFSSCVVLDANDQHLGGTTRLTCIEPYPERLHRLIEPGDERRFELVEEPLQDVGLGPFEELQSGDFLFIDSTHVGKLGSDVNLELFEILPSLPPGVFVHLHDIFYPFEYPVEWFEEGRVWNEGYMLRTFLELNDHFEIVLFNDYLWQKHHDALVNAFPSSAATGGGSIWLRRVS